MANSNDSYLMEMFLVALDAAEAGNWRAAARFARQIPFPIALQDVSQKNLSVRLSGAAWRGGWQFAVAIMPVFELPERQPGQPDPEVYAELLSDELFKLELSAFRKHLGNDDWERLVEAFIALMALPGGSSRRAEAIAECFTTLLIAVETKQETVVDVHAALRSPSPRPNRFVLREMRVDPMMFELPVLLAQYAARSDPYPDLGLVFLRETMLRARWPILCVMGLEAITALSCELGDLYDENDSLRRMSPEGRTLVEKAVTSNGNDEQLPADDL